MNGTINRLLTAALLSLCLVTAGCGGSGGSGTAGTNIDDRNNTDTTCSVADEKQVVHALMNDVYYWYDQVPDVDPADYANKEELLDVLIQPEKDLDHVYSYLTTKEEEDAFLNNAAYIGFGFSMGQTADGEIFLREVFPGGPAAIEGLQRGDEIIAIDGTQVSMMSSAQLNEALGPSEEGYTAEFDVQHPDGTLVTYSLSKTEVETPVVGTVVHDLGADTDTTYIFFRSFVDPDETESALDAAFAEMKARGDTKLVLDLRYNGGGLVSLAQYLGSLIAGVDNPGEILAKLEFNDRYASENEEHLLEALNSSVDVSDIVVITTGGTASASEMIINGLEPLNDTINVATVGSQSYGKPVGQSRLTFDIVDENCTEDILRAVTFRVVNSVGTSDYYTGFTPGVNVAGCPANDDVFGQFGDPTEDSLQTALYYLENGSCDEAAAAKARYAQAKMMSLQPEGNPFIRDGWDLLKGGAK